MFNPKITPGPWKWVDVDEDHLEPWERDNNMPSLESDKYLICGFGNSEEFYPTQGSPPNIPNSKAIAALPELLEVYKAAVRLLAAKSEYEEVKGITGLVDAIDTLEERHCNV